MSVIDTHHISEQRRDVFSEGVVPATPFPRKYINTAFCDQQDAVQAFTALLDECLNPWDIQLMTGWDFVEIIEQRQTLFCFG